MVYSWLLQSIGDKCQANHDTNISRIDFSDNLLPFLNDGLKGFYLPVTDGAPFIFKVDADLDDGKPA